MVSTSFDHESEMNITLPDASREVVNKDPQTINVAIDENSRVYVNQELLDDAQILTIKEKLYNISISENLGKSLHRN